MRINFVEKLLKLSRIIVRDFSRILRREPEVQRHLLPSTTLPFYILYPSLADRLQFQATKLSVPAFAAATLQPPALSKKPAIIAQPT